MDDPDDDFRLVARAQQGDYHSYDALVTRHRGRIFAMIRNMIYQEADAWDLSQEVFIKETGKSISGQSTFCGCTRRG